MKIIKLYITTIFVFSISAFCNAQSTVQNNTQTKLLVEDRVIVSPSEETGTTDKEQINNDDVKVIDGRKVKIDQQGIQSLAVPSLSPAVAPAKNESINSPE